jgi:hypothetical protein
VDPCFGGCRFTTARVHLRCSGRLSCGTHGTILKRHSNTHPLRTLAIDRGHVQYSFRQKTPRNPEKYATFQCRYLPNGARGSRAAIISIAKIQAHRA